MKLNKNLILKSNEIHIWSASLSENECDIDFFTTLLSKDEYERANNFRFYRDQKRYVIARGILRALMAKYLGRTPQAIEIIYGLWGKPCLPQEHPLRFNVSHSRNYALYAITLNYEIGIDLEFIDKNIELENIALSIFSPSELDYWQKLSSENKINFFFKLWVEKEAFLKALGKGWLKRESQMQFNKSDIFKKEQENYLSNNEITYPYCFESIPGYASALFVDGPPLRPLHYIWNKDRR